MPNVIIDKDTEMFIPESVIEQKPRLNEKCLLCDKPIKDPIFIVEYYNKAVAVHRNCGKAVIQNKLYDRHYRGLI